MVWLNLGVVSICLEGGLVMTIGVKKNGEVLVAEGSRELVAHNLGTGQKSEYWDRCT